MASSETAWTINPLNSECGRGVDDPLGRILEKRPAELPPLISPMDRKATEKRDGNGIRHVALKPTRCRRQVDTTGRQCVIANDCLGFRRTHRCESAAALIGERTPFKRIVELSETAIE